jgi:hypothetical protein
VFSGNPMRSAASAQDTRRWADRNGDRIPQFDELGPSTNSAFGAGLLAVRLDRGPATGWGKRFYNWDYASAVRTIVREAVPSDYRTALHGAARRGANTVIQFLVDNRAKVTVKDKNGATPLTTAESRLIRDNSTADLLRQFGRRHQIAC